MDVHAQYGVSCSFPPAFPNKTNRRCGDIAYEASLPRKDSSTSKLDCKRKRRRSHDSATSGDIKDSPESIPTPEPLVKRHPRAAHSALGGHSGSPALVMPSMFLALRNRLSTWNSALVALQPQCQISPKIELSALELFSRFQSQSSSTTSGYTAQLAACFWICVKVHGERICVPGRTLMANATQVKAQILADTEIDVLTSLKWNVFETLQAV